MIDVIFELVMTEAKKRPGDNLKDNAFLVIALLTDMIVQAFNRGLEDELKSFDKDG